MAGLGGDEVGVIRSLMPVRWIRSNRWCFSDAIIWRHQFQAAQTLGDQTAGESSHGDAFGFGRMIERRDEAVLKPGRVVFELRHESVLQTISDGELTTVQKRTSRDAQVTGGCG